MAVDNHAAIYDNATITYNKVAYKLVGMGAIACNNFDPAASLPTLEDVNGSNVINVHATYLCYLTNTTASFAVRITDIPDDSKDAAVLFVPYLVVEDAEGQQHTLYVNDHITTGTYNEVLNAL